jgi:hypothetical protein
VMSTSSAATWTSSGARCSAEGPPRALQAPGICTQHKTSRGARCCAEAFSFLRTSNAVFLPGRRCRLLASALRWPARPLRLLFSTD